MGMAASQARYLSLFARKSNLEYQAQQINQERSVLSQQCTAMYNSLLAMSVPTPPSTSEFTTLKYTGVQGATTFTIGNVKPSGDKYCVEIMTSKTGHALNQDYGTAKCGVEDDKIKGTNIQTGGTRELESLAGYYVIEDGTVKTLGETNYVTQENGKWIVTLPENATLFQKGDGTDTIDNPNAGKTTIAGNVAYNFADAEVLFPDFSWQEYRDAIDHSNLINSEKEAYTPEDFMVYITTNDKGVKTVKFALANDVKSDDGFTSTYTYIPNGSYTQSEEKDGCELEFDSQGMITRIGMPNIDDASGELLGYTYINLTAEKTTDNAAYQDAYNQYEYAQYEYDKKQEEINAKTEIIQQQDRNLELKLQRLDTERQQITAEIDALKTVIKDNVDKSFKTFSG